MKLKSINPHDQSVVGMTNISTKKEVVKAVETARKTYPKWKHLSLDERVSFVKKYRALLDKNKNKLARLITLEMGKPIGQALDDVTWELPFLDYYIKNATNHLAGEDLLKNKNEHYKIAYEPYGVCAVVAPWNFPLSMVNSGAIPALIAGNTAVVKPSEYTTLSQKYAMDLLNQTGIPKGVVNIIVGAGDVGAALIEQSIDLVWFTGSTKVGQEIFEKSGKKLIKSILEMGGSSPGIVFADADIKNAADNLFWARYLNCGQVCTAIKRLFVEKPLLDKFLKVFAVKVKEAILGNPIDEQTQIGPLVNRKQLDTLESQVKDATTKGANVLIGGKRPAHKDLSKGNYFEPTILTNVNFDMKVMKEEVFGPVISIMPFENEEEAIYYANKTEYGLSAEIYTRDLKKGERIAKEIQAGVVAVNTDNFFKPECPFGGYKNSGMGREYGKIGMQEFCQIKTIVVNK